MTQEVVVRAVHADGTAQVLGATQGYDESGMAIRGSIPLEPGMTVEPLYTVLSDSGERRQQAAAQQTVETLLDDGGVLTCGHFGGVPAVDGVKRHQRHQQKGDGQQTQAHDAYRQAVSLDARPVLYLVSGDVLHIYGHVG